jgi:hypothetical protein
VSRGCGRKEKENVQLNCITGVFFWIAASEHTHERPRLLNIKTHIAYDDIESDSGCKASRQ